MINEEIIKKAFYEACWNISWREGACPAGFYNFDIEAYLPEYCKKGECPYKVRKDTTDVAAECWIQYFINRNTEDSEGDQ